MGERLVVVGGDAGGMATASQARRLRDDLEIVAIERGTRTSFSACGIPYHVAGVIPDLDDLVARTPQEFRDRQRIDVRTGQEVAAVDLSQRTVEVRDAEHQRTYTLGFDYLCIGTGARPWRPPIPGVEADHVLGVENLDDAEVLLARARELNCRDVVVVGGGYIGCEMAEAFKHWGARVRLLEGSDQIMRTLDADMAGALTTEMERHGIEIRTRVSVEEIGPRSVSVDGEVLDADLVLLGTGVTPNSELAEAAGIELGARRAIRVDPRQRTSAEGVYAAGDCATSFHLVSRREVHVALGTVANRQARVAGLNIGGGYASFPGVLGTAVVSICGTEVGRTGLGEREADEAGLGYVTGKIDSTTRSSYFPGTEPMTVKVLAERETGRLLGGQILGGRGAGKRIDVLATAITAGMRVDEMVSLDLSYTPPLSPVWDPVVIACRDAARHL